MRKLITLGLIWGWSFFFIKVALRGLTPTAIAAGRLALGAAAVLIYLAVTRTKVRFDRTMGRHLIVMAVITNVIPFSLLAWAQQRITSALASVLNATTALMAAIVAALFLGERLSRSQRLGLLVSFSGVALAAGLGGSDVAGSSLTGTAAGLAAALCYAFGFAYSQHHSLGANPAVTTAGQLGIGALLLAPVGVFTSVTEGFDLTPTRAAAVGLLGVLGTGVGYLIYYRMIAEVGATKASVVTYLVPVVGLVVGVTIADEPFSWRLVIGAALIVAGVIAVQGKLPKLRRRVPPVLAALALLAGFGLGGCSAGEPSAQDTTTSSTASPAPQGCGEIIEEQLDPNSGEHLLPGAEEPAYLSDPPTSGAHASGGSPPDGLQAEPLSRPKQVQALEEGRVIVQFRDGEVTAAETETLKQLAGQADVVVGPQPSLAAPVVATAWVHKMLCEDADAAALEAFVTEFRGKGPGGH